MFVRGNEKFISFITLNYKLLERHTQRVIYIGAVGSSYGVNMWPFGNLRLKQKLLFDVLEQLIATQCIGIFEKQTSKI